MAREGKSFATFEDVSKDADLNAIKDSNIKGESNTDVDNNSEVKTDVASNVESEKDTNITSNTESKDESNIENENDVEVTGQTLEEATEPEEPSLKEVIKEMDSGNKDSDYRGYYIDNDLIKVLDRIQGRKKGRKGIKSYIVNAALRRYLKEEGYL